MTRETCCTSIPRAQTSVVINTRLHKRITILRDHKKEQSIQCTHTHIPVTAHTDKPNVCILHHSLQASRTLHRKSAELHRKQMVAVTQASVKTATRFGQNTNALCRNTQQRRSTHCVTPPQYHTGESLLRLTLPCGASVL